MSDISGDHSGSWTHTGSVTVLQQLAAGAALREDPEVLIRRLFTAVAGPMGLDFFIHFRYAGDGHALDLVATQGLDAEALPALHGVVLGQAVCGVVAQTRTPMAYADLDRSQDEQLTLLIDWGARAYVSYPLLDGAQLLGTLSFGSRTRPSLTDGELEVLRLATDLLSAALAHHRDHRALDQAREEIARSRIREEQLAAAVTSRDHIAQAKGMLMMRYDLSEDTAWQLLVRISQATNRKVRDVATAFKAHLLHQTPLPDDLSRQLAGQLSAAR